MHRLGPLAWRGSRVHRLFPCATAERPRRSVVAVSRRRRPDADLRRHPHRQFCPRFAVHAGRVSRLDARRRLRTRPARILGRGRARSARRRIDRRADRASLVEADLRGARASSARGDLRDRADRARRRPCDLGAGGFARPARRRLHGRSRSLRSCGAYLRSPAAGARPPRARRALGAHDPDAIRRRRTRGDRESDAGRSARHRRERGSSRRSSRSARFSPGWEAHFACPSSRRTSAWIFR